MHAWSYLLNQQTNVLLSYFESSSSGFCGLEMIKSSFI